MISSKVNGLERRMVFKPGYHKVNKNPKKNYGVHGMEIWFYIIGKKGAVHFGIYTDFMLPETFKWWKEQGLNTEPNNGMWPMGVDVGYHSRKPMYEGQTVVWPTKMREKKKMKDPGPNATSEQRMKWIANKKWVKVGKKAPNCTLLGVPCYCDGSAMRGEEFKDIFVREGDDKIWELLEGEYKATFKSKV